MYSQNIHKINEFESKIIDIHEKNVDETSTLFPKKSYSSSICSGESNSHNCFFDEKMDIIIKNTFICNFYKKNPKINIETVNLYIIELIRPFIEEGGASQLPSRVKENNSSFMSCIGEKDIKELINMPSLDTLNCSSTLRTEESIHSSVNSFGTTRGVDTTIKNEELFDMESSKNILFLLNKIYTTGNILPVNDSTMMFSRKTEKNIYFSTYSPKKKNKQQFFKSIEETEKNNGNYDLGSFSPERRLDEDVKFHQRVMSNGKLCLLTDYELYIIKRTNKCNILVESRNTKININNEEIQEFIQLIEENNCHGVFLSQNSGFFSKQDFHIEIYNKLIVVYVHNVGYNEQKIKMAINIIDNLAIKIREVHRQEDIYEVIIDKETLEEINKEYQTFTQQKENLINIFKENQKQFFLQIDEFKFPELNKYLSTKFSVPTNKQVFKCDLCKKFNGNNLKALAAHKRGCLRKIKSFDKTTEKQQNYQESIILPSQSKIKRSILPEESLNYSSERNFCENEFDVAPERKLELFEIQCT